MHGAEPTNGTGTGMQRITIAVDDELNRQFEAFMARHGYSNRSEAFRDLLRERIESDRVSTVGAAACVGCLTYVYDHGSRELPRRLVEAQHAHHDLNISTLHLHLDHSNCLEAMLLRGPTAEVTRFASSLIAQPGVRHGHLWLVPVELEPGDHRHGDSNPQGLPHLHSRPTT